MDLIIMNEQEVLNEIEKCRTLEKGWGKHGRGEEISEEVIERAKMVFNALTFLPCVFPQEDGSILLNSSSSDEDLAIVIDRRHYYVDWTVDTSDFSANGEFDFYRSGAETDEKLLSFISWFCKQIKDDEELTKWGRWKKRQSM